MSEQQPAQHAGVMGNERLTALAGLVLLVLIVAELVTTPNLRDWMSAHIFVGLLLVGPLAVKLGSTGYRFLRYYTGNPAYRRRGPPRLALRLLAPLLVAASVVLVGSGIGLLLTGPSRPGPVLALHALSAMIWLPLIAVHTFAYVWRAPRLSAQDWREDSGAPAPGRGLRLAVNLGALLAVLVAAFFMYPLAASWLAWIKSLGEEAPGKSFFVVGTVAAILALVATRPLRWR